MKAIGLLLSLAPLIGLSQTVNYVPNRKLDKTVDNMYYNTEFIFIRNITESGLRLDFETIENTLDSDWSATICTNRQCFSTIPSNGSLGTLEADQEAYFSFNFAANETVGTGRVRFLITNLDNQEMKDTVTFNYTVTEDGSIKARPWANVNYAKGVLHVLLQSQTIETSMDVININGTSVFSSTKIEPITSIPLRDFPPGLYVVIVRDENDHMITKKIAHY